MKIKLLCVAILLCAVIGTSALMPVVAQPKADEKQTVVEEVEVDAVKTARFINMLNHNYVYGIDFLTVDDMLSESIVGLLDARDSENPDFIKESYIKDFMYSMYGPSALKPRGERFSFWSWSSDRVGWSPPMILSKSPPPSSISSRRIFST